MSEYSSRVSVATEVFLPLLRTVRDEVGLRIKKDLDERILRASWNKAEAEEVQQELFLLWKRFRTMEEPVFSVSMGKTETIFRFFAEVFDGECRPLLDRVREGAQVSDGWLTWQWQRGALHLLDLRHTVSDSDSYRELGVAIPDAASRPGIFSTVDLEVLFVEGEEEVTRFLEIPVHGLGTVQYIDREPKIKPRNTVVILVEQQEGTAHEAELREVAHQRGWSLFRWAPGGAYSSRAAEWLAELMPKSKSSGFARMSVSRALKRAEAQEVIRFAVLMSTWAGSVAVPGGGIAMITAIHSYVVWRIAWLDGRTWSRESLRDIALVIAGSMSLSYGTRAILGSVTSGVPLLGRMVSAVLLASITEELGQSAMNRYLGRPASAGGQGEQRDRSVRPIPSVNN